MTARGRASAQRVRDRRAAHATTEAPAGRQITCTAAVTGVSWACQSTKRRSRVARGTRHTQSTPGTERTAVRTQWPHCSVFHFPGSVPMRNQILQPYFRTSNMGKSRNQWYIYPPFRLRNQKWDTSYMPPFWHATVAPLDRASSVLVLAPNPCPKAAKITRIGQVSTTP